MLAEGRKSDGARKNLRQGPRAVHPRNTAQYSTSGRVMSPSLKTGNHGAAASMLTSSRVRAAETAEGK